MYDLSPMNPVEVDLDDDIASLPNIRVCPVCRGSAEHSRLSEITFEDFPSMMRHWAVEHPKQAPRRAGHDDTGPLWRLAGTNRVVAIVPQWMEAMDEESVGRWVEEERIHGDEALTTWLELELPDFRKDAHEASNKTREVNAG